MTWRVLRQFPSVVSSRILENLGKKSEIHYLVTRAETSLNKLFKKAMLFCAGISALEMHIQSSILLAVSCPEENGVFADPGDHYSFISCNGGIAQKKQCPSNTIWNDQAKECSKEKSSKLVFPQ